MHKLLNRLAGAAVIRCDSIIDNTLGFTALEKSSDVRQFSPFCALVKRYCPSDVVDDMTILDMRCHCNLSSPSEMKQLMDVCIGAESQRILITIDPQHIKNVTSSLGVIAQTSGKHFVIAAVSVPAVMRDSDADFVLGLALGALCNCDSKLGGISVAGLPSVINDDNSTLLHDAPEVSFVNQPRLLDMEKWLFKKGTGTHISDSDKPIVQPAPKMESNELLTQWLVDTSRSTADSTTSQAEFYNGEGKQPTSNLCRYFTTLSNDPNMWLKPTVDERPRSDSISNDDADFVVPSASDLSVHDRSNSIRSCDFVPDIEELAICSASVDLTTPSAFTGEKVFVDSSGASSPRTPSTRTVKSSGSSWLKVICRASEPCMNISECSWEPTCAAALLQGCPFVHPVQPDSSTAIPNFSVFTRPFDSSEWLHNSPNSVRTKTPAVTITEKGRITFPAVSDLSLWLANRGSRANSISTSTSSYTMSTTPFVELKQHKQQWLLQKKDLEDGDDGLNSVASLEAKWSCVSEDIILS